MNFLRIFLPHLLGIVGAFLWFLLGFQLLREKSSWAVVLSLPLYSLLFLVALGLTPSTWLRATPTRDQNADIAVIFSFGYQLDGEQLKPGEANQYLWEWIVHNKPSQTRRVLVQEGIWVAADLESLDPLGLEIMRIHRHDPDLYVDTLNAAFCSMQNIQRLGHKKIMLVAHDLQLQRVAWDFERVAQVSCPDCMFLIPEIRDVPFPANSVHLQTRNIFIYKITELLIARPRDFLNPVPTRCIAPATSD